MTGDWARGLRVWDLDTGAEVSTVISPESSVTHTAMSEDRSRVATIRDRKTFSVWHTRENAARLRVRIGHAFSSARFAGEHGEYLVTRSSDTPQVSPFAIVERVPSSEAWKQTEQSRATSPFLQTAGSSPSMKSRASSVALFRTWSRCGCSRQMGQITWSSIAPARTEL